MASPYKILEGVRIISFTTGYAGPYAARLLAQYGAEVIKVESSPGGLDTFRHYGQDNDVNVAPRFIECNLAIRSMTVNIKHDAGKRIIKELAAKSNAVLVNFRPQVLGRLGLGDDELRKANPSIIILKLPGLGETGPKNWYGTWGFNLNAFSGMTYLWNHPGQDRPIGSQGVYPDHLGFISAPTIMMAALLRQRLTGKGASIDVSQGEVTAYTLGASYLESSINGVDPEPQGNRSLTAAPHGCYRCQGEERWCVVSVRSDDEWRRLCGVMGNAALADDSRFATCVERRRHSDELDAIMAEWLATQTVEDVAHRLQAAKVPAGVVQNGTDLCKDPQLRHRDYFQKYDDSPIGPFEVPRGGLLFKDMPEGDIPLTPLLGEHTGQVMRDVLGYDDDAIAKWKEEGVLV
jgi:benzylsuccinate CoA-transferase BbsF subunit